MLVSSFVLRSPVSHSIFIRGKQILCLITLLSLFACSPFKSNDRKVPRGFTTLADLEAPALEPDSVNPVPKVSLNELEESYRSTLEVVRDPAIRHKILLRLADIEMARSEKEQIDGVVIKENYFSEAITFYQDMLKQNEARQGLPQTPSNERLLYRLSKAYALDGQLEESNQVLERLVNEFPESPYVAESDFRRAELAFNNSDYKTAEKLYADVISKGADTPFYRNALYMHGWSRFKQARYRAAIPSFTEVLDLTLIEGQTIDQLSNSRKNLANDTLRILSIVYSYLDGPKTIDEVYAKLGVRFYQHLLYSRLGDLYLTQKRYKDSADTYRYYVQLYPNTDYSPDFSVKAIEVYEQGNFPSLILPAKEEYVENYGIYSDFWKERTAAVHESIKPKLNIFIDELASYYHARAFDLQKANTEYEKYHADKAPKPKADETLDGKTPEQVKQILLAKRFKKKPESPVSDFLKAAKLYRQFMETFPDDKKTPELVYFMGEAYYEAGHLPEAVEAYEIVAYKYIDEKRGAESGYSAIVSMQRLIKLTDGEKRTQWRGHKIDSSITFSDYYKGDPRAVGVLTAAAKELFDDGVLERAAIQAQRVTEWTPPPPKSLLVTAWLILSHSRFDLEQYAIAEAAYRQLLPLLEKTDPERAKVIERIAASMFKQAEQQIAAGEIEPAVDRLLAIRDIAPGSEIAISGQYDAANYLIGLKQWSRAEAELIDFKKRYPNHELLATLPAKFALIYQESEQWGKAADTLAGMALGDPNIEARRQALYLSAELYEKAGNLTRAIEQYRSYAHGYSEPFSLATEARYHLVQLYEKTNDDSKRNFWLKKLIEEHDKAGNAKTDRSRYLASFAAIKFANDDYNRFKVIKLKLPLKKSLAKKKKAMDTALKGYKKVIGYSVAEFATEANNKIGKIYGQLSEDLMNSQRPKGLDELALEQYEILLEEQAFPFEEKSIEIHTSNAERSWKGIYDDWVKKSFEDLAKLLPARYGKKEVTVEFSDGLY